MVNCQHFPFVLFWLIPPSAGLWCQVSVAALLDNFISASSEMEMDEKLRQAQEFVRDRLERSPMEPLLIKLARDFTDSQDLSERLLKLYKVKPALHSTS